MKRDIDELLEYREFEKRKDGSFYLKAIVLLIAVVMFGVYIGNLLFGENSLELLLNLQQTRDKLQIKTETLKKENAKLQKEYFELKQLSDTDSQ